MELIRPFARQTSSTALQQALVHQRCGELDTAQALYITALAGDLSTHNRAEVLHLLGLIALKRSDHLDAIDCIVQAIGLVDDKSAYHANLATAFRCVGRLDDALASYGRAIALQPGAAEHYFNQGITLHDLKSYEAAIAAYDRALQLKPDYAEAYFNRGNSLREIENLEAALLSYEQAFTINPQYAEAYTNHANLLQKMDRLDEAVASYSQVLRIQPGNAEIFGARGQALGSLNRIDEAINNHEHLLALRPQDPEASICKGIWHLLKGEYEQGWPLYEMRWLGEVARKHRRVFEQPLWLGDQPLAGKTILIHSEQGFGDIIQFGRYTKLLAVQGAKVILDVPEPLVRLFRRMEGVASVISPGTAIPPFDFHCPVMSLALAFKTTLSSIPAPQAYLRAPRQQLLRWATELGLKQGLRIGIAWSGNSKYPNDSRRSLHLVRMLDGLPEACELISLQKEVRESDREALRSTPRIRHFGDRLKDFADTAALCKLVDLVITVDTSIAHLSGALGCPTWVLLPYAPDWRWLLNRDDSPWYPTVRLYRQGPERTWAPLFKRLSQDLTHWPMHREASASGQQPGHSSPN